MRDVVVALVLVLVSCTSTAKQAPSIEVLQEHGCRDSEFRLTCRGLNTRIAIRDAIFVPDNETHHNSSSICLVGPVALPLNGSAPTMSEDDLLLLAGTNASLPQTLMDLAPDYNLRRALNHRCSGVNHCSFILRDDHAEARDWGPGSISIKYACIPEERMSKFCGGKVNISEDGEGFLATPGYPKYYVGQKDCVWEVRGAPGQTIALEVLDLALRGLGPGENECTDVLEVTSGDNPEALLHVCGERANLPVVSAASGVLRVRVRTASKTLFPKRGVLLRYSALSCPSIPPPPKDGYQVHHNDSLVTYMCCVGMAFPDTGMRRREVRCGVDFRWDQTVPDCVNATLLSNFSRIEEDTSTNLPATMKNESDLMLDFVVPTVIIATLLIGNLFILALIFRLRRTLKENKEFGNEEEMGEILPNGESTTKGVALL